jgi:hypothetical protein
MVAGLQVSVACVGGHRQCTASLTDTRHHGRATSETCFDVQLLLCAAAADDGILGQISQLVPLAVLPLPINALVYTLDGVLVGASDFG